MSGTNFIYPPYFELWQKYQQIDDVLEILHYAKISNAELNDETLEHCIYTLSEFADAFNKDYSSVLGLKIKLIITSHKWNKIYSDKNKRLPTVVGFDQ